MAVLVGVAAVLLHGPGFRLIADWGLRKGLEPLGLQAEFEVDGTLSSGLVIRNFVAEPLTNDLSGGAQPASGMAIQQLAFETAELRYSFSDLLHGRFLAAPEVLRLHELDAVIELADKPAGEEPDPDGEAETGDSPIGLPEALWDLLDCTYDLRAIDLRLVRAGEDLLLLRGFAFDLPPFAEGSLEFERLKIADRIDQTSTQMALRSADGSLAMGRLELGPDLALESLTVSRNSDHLLTLEMLAGGGRISVGFDPQGNLAVTLQDGPIDVAAVAARLGFADLVKSGSVDRLEAEASGLLAPPQAWSADIRLAAKDLTISQGAIDSVELTTVLNMGDLHATLRAERHDTILEVDAKGGIPETGDSPAIFADTRADLDLDLTAPRVEAFLEDYEIALPLTGGLAARGRATLEARQVGDVKLDLTSDTLAYEGIATDSIAIEVTAVSLQRLACRFDLALEPESKLAGTIDIGLEEFDYEADIGGEVHVGKRVRELLETFGFSKPIDGVITLSAGGEGVVKPADANSARHEAELTLNTDSLSYDGVAIDAVALEVTSPTPGSFVGNLELSLDDENRILADGGFELADFAYRGEAEADLAVNERLRSLLVSFGFDKALAGSVSLSWRGDGVFGKASEANEAPEHRGDVTLSASSLRYADAAEISSAHLEGDYQPGRIGLRELHFDMDPFSLAARGGYEQHTLSLESLSLGRAGQPIASGTLTLPLDPGAFEDEGVIGFFEQEGDVVIKFHSETLDLAELVALAGVDSPVQGLVAADVDLRGQPRTLGGEGRIDVQGLRLTATDEVPPGDLAASLRLTEDRIDLEASFAHPEIETLALSATLPFTPERWTQEGASPLDEPLEARAQLPASELEFVRAYAPMLKVLDGTLALDLTADGTLREPRLTGEARLELASLQLDDPTLPTVRDGAIRLRADGRTLYIDQFDALVSGGSLSLAGKVDLPQGGEEAFFGLDLTAREALIARNRDLNVRADADLTFEGPWSGARLAGEIAIVNSRFTKNIDLLPISLLGHDESDLPEITDRPTVRVPPNLDIGIQTPPFRDWLIDVALITRDPFLIRSNLASIDVVSELRVGGSGAKPMPTGRIYTSNGRLTLPFSRLDIAMGELRFSEASGFNAEIDLEATAAVRSYKISIFGYGNLLAPDSTLTSEPPLPEEDIVTLLATGVTRDELTGGSGAVAASKAAVLFLKNLRSGSEEPGIVDDEESVIDRLGERTTIDIGQTDPRTGKQTLSGRLRLLKQLYVVLNVGAEGEYRGLLKYIFKFR